MFASLKKKVQIEDPQFKASIPDNILQPAAIHSSKLLSDQKIVNLENNILSNVQIKNNNDTDYKNAVKLDNIYNCKTDESSAEIDQQLFNPLNFNKSSILSESFGTLSSCVTASLNNYSKEICSNCLQLSEQIQVMELSLKEVEIKYKKSEEYARFLTEDIINLKKYVKQLELDLDKYKITCEDLSKNKDDLLSEINGLTEMLVSEKEAVNIITDLSLQKDQQIIDLNLHLDKEKNNIQDLVAKLENSISLETVKNQKDDEHRQLLDSINFFEQQITDKNKTIKKQEQLINDLKKTIHKELNSKTIEPFIHSALHSSLEEHEDSQLSSHKNLIDINSFKNTNKINDVKLLSEMNFKYLRHVILKFMLCRETEALHLIKAVSMLLNYNSEEQKLLRETLQWRMSWFGSKPQITQIAQPYKINFSS